MGFLSKLDSTPKGAKRKYSRIPFDGGFNPGGGGLKKLIRRHRARNPFDYTGVQYMWAPPGNLSVRSMTKLKNKKYIKK